MACMLLFLIYECYATRIDLGLLLLITIWLVGLYGLLVVLDQPPWEHTPKNEGRAHTMGCLSTSASPAQQLGPLPMTRFITLS
jgi:hypothetical protein